MVFRNLDYIRRHDQHCLPTLIRAIAMYQAYQKGECLSEHTVWEFLYHETGYQHGLNREQVIAQMATAISHLLNQINFVHSSTQRCHSHTAVWWELDHIVKHNHHGKICVENLIHHIVADDKDNTTNNNYYNHNYSSTNYNKINNVNNKTNSFDNNKDDTAYNYYNSIKINYNNVRIDNKKQQHYAYISFNNTKGQSTECSRIRTVEELGKFHQLYPQLNTDCSNYVSTSNLIVRELCDFVPNSLYWKPGRKVVDACNTLQTYQPVATFSSAIFPVDGLAGIFLGCTSTSIRIATQECGGTFKILELSRHPTQSERFTHTALNYYVINY
ncbi:GATA zinc finger domain-containing protein 15-like [Saccostrea echinata]|uniref:GATA zinc finger domain-containing protein 15-like n=1 Tax=Saccostrea echinata TaxID=191078 RepID=UPI002A7F2DA3|nr:GATA zinc finger domain-containing protein 15-like [Saccostrea echinata]